MIVNSCAEGWRVMFQNAHALLAAQIAAALHPRYQLERWVEVLEAIAFHDDEQQDFTGRNWLNAAGAPLDFTQRPYTLEQAQRVSEVSMFKSSRVALLISLHMSFLYEPLAKVPHTDDLKAFCRQQRQQQDKLRKRIQFTKTRAEEEYALLRWCDQLSLYLCQDAMPIGGYRIETGYGPGGLNYLVSKVAEGSIAIDPWPFAMNTQEFFCEARTLGQLSFKNDAELLTALQAAIPLESVWTFKPAEKG